MEGNGWTGWARTRDHWRQGGFQLNICFAIHSNVQRRFLKCENGLGRVVYGFKSRPPREPWAGGGTERLDQMSTTARSQEADRTAASHHRSQSSRKIINDFLPFYQKRKRFGSWKALVKQQMSRSTFTGPKANFSTCRDRPGQRHSWPELKTHQLVHKSTDTHQH